MKLNETLVEALKASDRILTTFLQDITEEDSLVRGGDEINHVRWQLGHAAVSHWNLAAMVGTPPAWEDAQLYKRLFARGSELSEDVSEYPSLAKLRARYEEAMEAAMANLRQLDEERLHEMIDLTEQWRMELYQAVLFLSHHVAYHAGQIAILRAKVLKKPAVVG